MSPGSLKERFGKNLYTNLHGRIKSTVHRSIKCHGITKVNRVMKINSVDRSSYTDMI